MDRAFGIVGTFFLILLYVVLFLLFFLVQLIVTDLSSETLSSRNP